MVHGQAVIVTGCGSTARGITVRTSPWEWSFRPDTEVKSRSFTLCDIMFLFLHFKKIHLGDTVLIIVRLNIFLEYGIYKKK